jgi:hypothetical protein
MLLCRLALNKLRNGKHVQEELEFLKEEFNSIESKHKFISYIQIIFNKKYNRQLLTSILLHLIQQSCAFITVKKLHTFV